MDNRYVIGAYALGATADESAAALWQAQQNASKQPESGISLGGVALLVGVLVVGAVTWPHVSRWLR